MSLRKKVAILSIISCLIFPLLVSAVEIKNPLKYDTFGELIEAIINFIFKIALVLAPLFIIIGGFYFVAAQGDPAKIKTGQDIIKYTLIGLLIILLSRGLVAVITEIIKVK